MTSCPRCRSNRVHRSRTKTAWERLRRDFSHKRLFRCDECGWRGWGEVTERARPGSAPPEGSSDAAAPDFDAIDQALADGRAASAAQKTT